MLNLLPADVLAAAFKQVQRILLPQEAGCQAALAAMITRR